MAQLRAPRRVLNAQTFLRRYEGMTALGAFGGPLVGIVLLFVTQPHVLLGTLLCGLVIAAGVAIPKAIWGARAQEARRTLEAWRLIQTQKDAALLAVEARLRLEDRTA